MDIVTREELRMLAAVSGGPCVSIFLPTHRAGRDSRTFVQEDLIRFKNQVRDAEGRLVEAGSPVRQAQALLEPVRGLLDDSLFWQYQGEGLAVFAAPAAFRTYRVPLRLPELVVVAEQFHVKPLLALLTGDGRFYVLALSQNAVRLLEGTRHGASEVDLGGVPRSLQEALRYDEPQRPLQAHTTVRQRPGRRAMVFHGHGVGTEDFKDNVLRYCREIDRGLADLLRGTAAPLVLAGVEYVQAIYRAANTHPFLLDGGIPGNPEGARPDELHARAWPLVEPHFRQTRHASMQRYRALSGTGRALAELGEVLAAASHGRVEVLFVPVGVQRWGRFDAERGVVETRDEPRPGDEDLLNLAAVRTILNGGTVYAVPAAEMPDAAPVAAVLRY